jgi:dienelactone hydrolase
MRQFIHSVAQFATQVLLLSFCAQISGGQTEKPNYLPSPGQIVNVVCASDASQSYALYLPSAYTATKRWPIIYFFDPGGRGRRPIDLYKNIAETYGFIFAGSNNSRNFSADESQAVNAIWQDTHVRLSLDGHRVYTSGFSGGARVAGAMALSSPGQISGVIAHGAGYPTSRRTPNDKLLYYFAVGDKDFNWQEVITTGHEREKEGLLYRVNVYSGTHQWATVPVMEDAVEWLQVKAMQAGDLPRDNAFIDRQFQALQKRADDAGEKHDALAQLAAYEYMVSDFTGLRDVNQASAKLATLKQSPAVKAALKNEQEQISQQLRIEREISPKLRTYESGDVSDPNALRIEILQAMNGLKDQAAHAKHEEERLVLQRAFQNMMVEGIENGQQEFQAKHFDKAESCFDLMRQISDEPWPALLLAETRAAMGNKKQALKDLRDAVHRGLKDAEVLESDKQLQVLNTEPDFQKLLAELKGKSQ